MNGEESYCYGFYTSVYNDSGLQRDPARAGLLWGGGKNKGGRLKNEGG